MKHPTPPRSPVTPSPSIAPTLSVHSLTLPARSAMLQQRTHPCTIIRLSSLLRKHPYPCLITVHRRHHSPLLNHCIHPCLALHPCGFSMYPATSGCERVLVRAHVHRKYSLKSQTAGLGGFPLVFFGNARKIQVAANSFNI